MGNCQAVNAAVLVLQHPGGKVDRYYGSVSVSEVMSMYPGHYVSLIVPLTDEEEMVKGDDKKQEKPVRFTRVQLLRPTENLVLGHAYRLITSQGEETREAISCVNEFNFHLKVQNVEAVSSKHIRSYELSVLIFFNGREHLSGSRVENLIRNCTE